MSRVSNKEVDMIKKHQKINRSKWFSKCLKNHPSHEVLSTKGWWDPSVGRVATFSNADPLLSDLFKFFNVQKCYDSLQLQLTIPSFLDGGSLSVSTTERISMVIIIVRQCNPSVSAKGSDHIETLWKGPKQKKTLWPVCMCMVKSTIFYLIYLAVRKMLVTMYK